MSKIGKRAILLLLALPIGFNVMAQETKKPTLEELIPGGESYRYAENLYGLQWWGDECIKPGVDTLYSIQPKTGKETMVITREQINKVLEENKAGKLSHLYSVRFPWTDKAQMLFTIAGKFIVYDFKNNQVISTFKPKDGANNEDYCAASGNVAYTIDNNLYVNEKAVTNEPEGIVCGQTVHRNEFGINKGTFWSPKGNLLAFYRMDESMVTQYPLVDITARVGEVNNVRYPMAGMTSHQVKVGIYNPATGKSIYLNAGDPTDRYFTNISWAPDEKSLYLIEVNRDQNHAKLSQYNAETGEPMGVLYEEMHPKYVEPQNRRKMVESVLLPMMVFVHADPSERKEVLSFSTVSRYMVMRGESTPAVIPDEQMARFRFMLDYSEEAICMNSSPLARGEKVRVVKGPLTGLVGELVSVDGKSKIAVRLNMLGCACVDMPIGYVESADIHVG